MWSGRVSILCLLVLSASSCTALTANQEQIAKCMTDYMARSYTKLGYDIFRLENASQTPDSERAQRHQTLQRIAENVLWQSFPQFDPGVEVILINREREEAFTLGPGYIFVTEGLLRLIETETELAWVFAHEMGHWEANHSIERLTRGLGPIITQFFYGSPQVICNLFDHAESDTNLFTKSTDEDSEYLELVRKQEFEADLLGFQAIIDMNYDYKSILEFALDWRNFSIPAIENFLSKSKRFAIPK